MVPSSVKKRKESEKFFLMQVCRDPVSRWPPGIGTYVMIPLRSKKNPCGNNFATDCLYDLIEERRVALVLIHFTKIFH